MKPQTHKQTCNRGTALEQSIGKLPGQNLDKKGKRKAQGMSQSQTVALPRHQEEEETDKTKQAQIEQTCESTKISSLFPKRGNRNAKRTEKHKNKIT